jgi:valyl-tRNA synthetase
VAVLKDADVVVPMASMVDLAAEQEKIRKEIEQVTADITRLENLLKGESFVSKAPPAVVAREKQRLIERQEHLVRLKQQLG